MKRLTGWLLASAVAGVFSGEAFGQLVVTQLLSESDITAPMTQPTSVLANPYANNVGGWAIRVRTGDTTSSDVNQNTDMLYGRVSSNAAVGTLVSEGLINGVNVQQLSSIAILTDSGSLMNAGVSTNTIPRLQNVFVNGTKIAASKDLMPTGLGYDGMYFGRSVVPTGLSSTGDAFVLTTVNPNQSLPTGETRIALLKRTSAGAWSTLIANGQTIANVGTIAANKTNSLGSVSVSKNGAYWLTIVDTNTAVSNTTSFALKNGVLERTASGLPLRVDPSTALSPSIDGVNANEAITSLGLSDVNNSGSVVRSVGLGPVGSSNTITSTIFVDGKLKYREGQSVGGVTLGGNINNLSLNGSGDLLWSMTSNGLFLNDTLLVPANGAGVVGDKNGVVTPLTSFSENIGTAITDRDANGYVTVYFLGRTDGTTNTGSQTDKLYSVRVNLSRVGWAGGSGTWGASSSGFSSNPAGVGAAVSFETATSTPSTVTLTSPQTVGGLWVGSQGGYTLQGGALTLDAGVNSATVTSTQGTNTISSSVVVKSPLVVQTSDSASVLKVVQPVSTSSSVTKVGAGRLEVASLSSGSVSVAGGELRVVGAQGGGAATGSLGIETSGVSITTSGLLNLVNKDMIVHGGNTSATVLALRQAVARWYNNGSKDGTTGLAASAATAYGDGSPSSFMTLAVFPNSYNGQAYYNSYDGVAVTASDVIVRYTYMGDLNVDGVIDGKDFKVATESALFGLTGWQNGDFNYDDRIDSSDLAILTAAQAANLPALPQGWDSGTSGTAAIPEPGIGLVAAGGGLILGLRRRRA